MPPYTRPLQTVPAGDTMPGGETIQVSGPFITGGIKPVPPAPPEPPTVDADAGSVGATFIGDDIIDRWIPGTQIGMGSIPVFTARTILAWEVLFLPGVSNGIRFDVWKTTYANYETVGPANSIFPAAPKPYIIAANKNRSASMVGVDTAIAAGDILVFVCLSRGTPRWANVALQTVDNP